MKTDSDARITSFLNEKAPPTRDPLFRLKVLERRERQRFQRRMATIACSAVVLIAIAWLGHRAGVKVAEAASLALLWSALVGVVLCVPVFARVLRQVSK